MIELKVERSWMAVMVKTEVGFCLPSFGGRAGGLAHSMVGSLSPMVIISPRQNNNLDCLNRYDIIEELKFKRQRWDHGTYQWRWCWSIFYSVYTD